MNNKKTVIVIISVVLGTLLIISFAIGLALCLNKSNNKNSQRKKDQTKISKEIEEKEPTPTPLPTVTLTPTPTSTPIPEATVPESEDFKTKLIDKLVGVWGMPGGWFMQFSESGDIYSGWIESDARPPQHILEVEKIGENKYELLIKEDEWESDGEYYEASTYKVIYDGSFDGFEKVLHLLNEYNDIYLLRIGDTLEEAELYPTASLEEEYEKIEKEISVKD